MISLTSRSVTIKTLAKKHGFDYCGISRAGYLEEEAPRLENWLKQKKHGEMRYMEEHFDKRLNPALLLEGAKSVISLLLNYFPHKDLAQKGYYKISKYAYGKDYHRVIKKKLKLFLKDLQLEFGGFNARYFVDSAPVMERQWASKSGLGWTGKNTLLINPKSGSFHFIADMITDLECEYDGPVKDYCGTCTRCIDACPTEALQPYQIDASRCLSYLTIELKSEIQPEFAGHMEDWIFGCDICQDVCPWNRFSHPHQEPLFFPNPEFTELTNEKWKGMGEDTFNFTFKGSPLKRAGFTRLKNTIRFISDPN